MIVFRASKVRVSNRGVPPDSFLQTLVDWGKSAPAQLFAPNDNFDIYSIIAPVLGPPAPELGPWTDPASRCAAMLEAMRVHAGLESSWNWNEGVDTTNKTSLANLSGQETGIFQVSFDSIYLGGPSHPMRTFAATHGVATDIHAFIEKMKSDHVFALDYYAHLVRNNVKWAGPLISHAVNTWVSRASMNELKALLAA